MFHLRICLMTLYSPTPLLSTNHNIIIRDNYLYFFLFLLCWMSGTNLSSCKVFSQHAEKSVDERSVWIPGLILCALYMTKKLQELYEIVYFHTVYAKVIVNVEYNDCNRYIDISVIALSTCVINTHTYIAILLIDIVFVQT